MTDPTETKQLSPAAKRALAEAEARRLDAENAAKACEHNGPAGAEPTRFGDWERKGIAYDF
jgi:hypothetical protein